MLAHLKIMEPMVKSKDERFVSRYIVKVIYRIIWKYHDITIIQKYCNILMIFFASDIDKLWPFMDLKKVANHLFSCVSAYGSFSPGRGK